MAGKSIARLRAFQWLRGRVQESTKQPAIVAMTLLRAEEEANRRGWWFSRTETGGGRVRVTLYTAEEPHEALATVGGIPDTEEDVTEVCAWLALEASLYEKMRAIRAA